MNMLLGSGTYFFSIFKRSSWAVSLIRVGMGVIIALLIAEVLLAKGFSFIHSFTYIFFLSQHTRESAGRQHGEVRRDSFKMI